MSQLKPGDRVLVEGQEATFRGLNDRIPGDCWIEFDHGGGWWSYSPSSVRPATPEPADEAPITIHGPLQPASPRVAEPTQRATLHSHMLLGTAPQELPELRFRPEFADDPGPTFPSALDWPEIETQPGELDGDGCPWKVSQFR